MAYTAIDNPELYFQVKLYTGNSSSTHAITLDGDEDMTPAMVWSKNRPYDGSQRLHDVLLGAGNALIPDYPYAINTNYAFSSFDSNGWTIGTTNNSLNDSSYTYVSWCWAAGTTSGINATGADVTPEAYSFNQTAGFSIIDYHPVADTADQEVPHGLAAVPHFIIAKTTNSVQDWAIYHHKNTSAPETDYLELNNTQATVDDAAWWSDTAPTSVLFTVGTASETGGGNENHAYCWTEKQGFSKFGGYEGNGNADGTFVYTGFRPAYVMTKSIDSTSAWHIFDSKREGYNPDNDALEANAATVEATADQIDLLSNGFKFRIATDPNVAETYIYAAFAEQPFVNSNGVPCNAR